MIITKEVEITVNNNQKKRYADLGYDVSQSTVLVKIIDIPKYSRYIINASCDICNIEKYTNYASYNISIENGGYYACSQKCSRAKVEQTNLARYGFKAPAQNEKIHQKIENTTLERYGVKNPSQSDDFKNKMKQTNLDRYGVENVFENEEIKNKIKKTILEKYGVVHQNQHPEIKQKSRLTISNIPNFYENIRIKGDITREKNIILKKESMDWKKWEDYKKLSTYYFDRIKNVVLENWDGVDYYDKEYIKPYFNLNYNDDKYPTIDHVISVKKGFELGIDPKEINDLKNLVVTKRIINSKKGKKILDISKLDMFELNPEYVPDISIINNYNYGDDWCICFNDGTIIYINDLKRYCLENNYTYIKFLNKKYSGNIISVTKIKKP